MSILKCFKRNSERPDSGLPLSKELDLYTIRLVKEKVKSEMEKSQCQRKNFSTGKEQQSTE